MIRGVYLVIFSFLISSYSFGKTSYKISLSPSCPYYCTENEKDGYVVELLNLFFKKHKIKVSFQTTPYSRLYDSLKSGASDLALFTSLDLREISDLVVYNPPLGVSSSGIVSKSGTNPSIIDHSDLKDKPIFLSQGSKASEKILIELEKINTDKSYLQLITGSNIHNRLIDLVALERADFAIGDYNVLKYFHSRSKYKEKVVLTPISLSGYSPLKLVSNRSLPIQAILEKDLMKFIDDFRKSGKLTKLLKEYNITDWNLLLTR